MASHYPDKDYVEEISFHGNVTIRRIKNQRRLRKSCARNRLFNNELDDEIPNKKENTFKNNFSISSPDKLKFSPASSKNVEDTINIPENLSWVSNVSEVDNSDDSIRIIEIHSEPDMSVDDDIITSIRDIVEVIDGVVNLNKLNNGKEQLEVFNKALPFYLPENLESLKNIDCQSVDLNFNPPTKTPITVNNENIQVEDTEVKISSINVESPEKDEVNTSCRNTKINEILSGIVLDDDSNTSINIKSNSNLEYLHDQSLNLEDESIDDSFLTLEHVVDKLCTSPNTRENLNNTLEMVDYVLNKEYLKETQDLITNDDPCNVKNYYLPSKETDILVNAEIINKSLNLCKGNNDTEHGLCDASSLLTKENLVPLENVDFHSVDMNMPSSSTTPGKINNENNIQIKDTVLKISTSDLHSVNLNMNSSSSITRPVTLNNENHIQMKDDAKLKISTVVKSSENICGEDYKTPIKLESDKLKNAKLRTITPKNNLSNKNAQKSKCTPAIGNNIEHTYKTPKNILSKKQQFSSVKKSPGTSNTYQDVMSPVAYYIKRSPQVPLIRNVHPKKPLPGATSIPHHVKDLTENKIINKENVMLPSISYRSAKKTQVIPVSDKKMPQNQWAKKLTSSPAVVRKHVNKDGPHTKTPIPFQNDDSFANLSLINQADVSILIEKPAFS